MPKPPPREPGEEDEYPSDYTASEHPSDYEDDSNEEDNWRNDYPDEEYRGLDKADDGEYGDSDWQSSRTRGCWLNEFISS